MILQEYCLDKLLSNFNMEMPQFVDLCIMLGCDYCDTIRGVGPKKAFDLIIKHKSIENVLENLDTKVCCSQKRLLNIFVFLEVPAAGELEL